MNSKLDILQRRLSEIEALSNEHWLQSLPSRKRKELEFHDRDRDTALSSQLDKDSYEKFYGNQKYYAATKSSRAYAIQWIQQHARGKVFLDYACGNGDNAFIAAKAGATLSVGIDISRVSVENAKQIAITKGLAGNTRFVQADAENTLFPDDSVDTVVCSGMLHHLDLSYAFPELRRILVPGGRILGVEALDYNPAIKLYRRFTPDMRTEWEKAHILSLKDIEFARRFFEPGDIRFWHIAGILTPHAPALAAAFASLDTVLTKMPLVQLMAWIFTFELMKKAEI